MNITRRSFVKKTSYSAAAVTILGAGKSLATSGSYPLNWWSTYNVTISAGTSVVIVTPAMLPGDFDNLFIDTYFEESDFHDNYGPNDPLTPPEPAPPAPVNFINPSMVELVDSGQTTLAVGPHEIVYVDEVIPDPENPPAVQVIVSWEQVAGGFKYTITSEVTYVVQLSNNPNPWGF